MIPKYLVLICIMLVVFSVTVSATSTKSDIERIDFVHHAKPIGPAKPGKTESCYKLMGVQWNNRLPVNYVINPTNPQGISTEFITSSISKAAETWDAATKTDLFSNGYSVNTDVQYGLLDGTNAITFGSYSNSNVIAVTSVWYNKRTRQIVEFDMLFNTYFAWGDARINPDLMDLENIATHELGHAVGLSDLYTISCASVTMYGYSTEGEISKRSLELPDITGLQSMY